MMMTMLISSVQILLTIQKRSIENIEHYIQSLAMLHFQSQITHHLDNWLEHLQTDVKHGLRYQIVSSPTQGAELLKGPTAIIKSVSKMSNDSMNIGMVHNFKIMAGLLDTIERWKCTYNTSTYSLYVWKWRNAVQLSW